MRAKVCKRANTPGLGADVARALCVADGSDPEAMIEVGMDLVDEAGGERYHDVVAPAWTTYTSEARRFIAAARAMGLIE
jgi:hypothetical protein